MCPQRAALVAAFLAQDRSVNDSIDCAQSGTTAAVCHLQVDRRGGAAAVQCRTAWVGDSRAVLGRVRPDGSLSARDVSVDHRPEHADERRRIEEAGGVVEAVKDDHGGSAGPARVWYLPQVSPGLSMSRSIGDSVGAHVGVTAEPEVVVQSMQPEDALMVIASDGVWEFLSSQQVPPHRSSRRLYRPSPFPHPLDPPLPPRPPPLRTPRPASIPWFGFARPVSRALARQVVSFVCDRLRGRAITEEAVGRIAAELCAHARSLWRQEGVYVDDITAILIVIQQTQQIVIQRQPPERSRPPTAPTSARTPAPCTPTGAAAAAAFGGGGGHGWQPHSDRRGASTLKQAIAESPPPKATRRAVGTVNAQGKRVAVSGEAGPSETPRETPRETPSGTPSGTPSASGTPAAPPRQSPDEAQLRFLRTVLCDPRRLLFRGMDADARDAVAACLTRQSASADEMLYERGDRGDNAYVVESGRYEAMRAAPHPPAPALGPLPMSPPTALSTATAPPTAMALSTATAPPTVESYERGDGVGELALLYSYPREATLRCVEAGTVWRLDRRAFHLALQRAADRRRARLVARLRAVAPLDDLEPPQLAALAAAAQTVRCGRDEVLLADAPPAGLYLLETGAMRIQRGAAPPAEVAAPSAFGMEACEVAAVGSAAAGGEGADERMTATATTDCELVRLPRESIAGAIRAARDGSLRNERALAAVAELANLNLAERRRMARLMTISSHADGELIDDPNGDTLRVLHSGTVVGRPAGGAPASGALAGGAPAGGERLGAGAVLGVGALVRPEATGSTAYVAEGGVVCAGVSRDAVHRAFGPLAALLADREATRARQRARARALSLAGLRRGRVIGMGTFGVVRVADDPASGAAFALKTMGKQRVYETGQARHILDEASLLAECDHPFVVRLVRAFDEVAQLHLLLELTQGGELCAVLRASQTGAFPERRCQFYAAMVVLAFEYLHDKQIAYRDLKPENLLFDADGYLKLVDLGLAKRVPERTWTLCGTPEYMAPEMILHHGHGLALDWWTLGVLIYEMLVGYPPFEGGEEPLALYANIVANEPRFPSKIGAQSHDLIGGLLTSDASARLGSGLRGGADDVKRHPFFKRMAWQSLLLKKIEAPYKPPITDAHDTSHFGAFDDPDVFDGSGQPPPPSLAFPSETFADFSRLAQAWPSTDPEPVLPPTR